VRRWPAPGGPRYSPCVTRSLAALVAAAFTACAPNHIAGPPPPDSTQAAAFLDTLEQRTFHYFWDLASSTNGLIPDRWPSLSASSIAAVGFGLTAYPIGVERGYITRDQARQRVLNTLNFFWTAAQDSTATGVTGYKGFFYHFLDLTSGQRSGPQIELSTIDTALLLAGVLTCQSYFDSATATDSTIRALADSIYRRADWQWATHNPPAITLGWTPENGFLPYDWRGYNEAMILYILALGSPTHPADSAAWTAWTSTYQWGSFEGQTYLGFAPLFGHQYSHVWIDFRGIQDAYMQAHGIDYFVNSRRATYAERGYATANPRRWKGYGANVWGFTASDGPADMAPYHTYFARGASFTEIQDDGTIAPTAAGGSIPFAPEIAIPALWTMRATARTCIRRPATASSTPSTRPSAARRPWATWSPDRGGSTPTTSASTRVPSWR
jgi:hypothetical protein